MTYRCLYCVLQNLINAMKKINVCCDICKAVNVNCNITTPVEVTGTLNTNVQQPLEIKGNIIANVTGGITADINQPLTITGTINTVSTDLCAEAWTKILSQSSKFSQIVFKNDEQYNNITDLTVDNGIVSFSAQNQKIQTTVCNIEFVLL